ncbi:M4 family metallopeptidase [Streptomyces sp. SP18CS02]|uniref:M4 family metallopeptidase n=1 Tax=Streptomyces sp. SP18CS02 TaxID=3002531 RepID=UPI002E764ED4|nr:M4 family metallopeptidase [Streptomyces sp. SP18CS02]MEE1754458.1 M4 family metallopeptidase [Streptomyces sp. SP18CS02]
MRRLPRTAAAAGSLLASIAIAAVLPAETAGADPASPSTPPRGAAPRAGALPDALSATEHAALLADARRSSAVRSRELGLGSQEALVPRAILKDADGTLHTRYDRTYAGLPVLGGDLVLHTAPNGGSPGVEKATRISLPTTDAAKSADSAKTLAVGRAQADGVAAPRPDVVRKVIWAASNRPVLAWETVVGGVQRDRTPSELHVITDARTGSELFTYQAVDNGVGHSHYSGQVDIGTAKAGDGFAMTDATRGGHSTYDVAHTTSLKAAGTLLTGDRDTWGDGSPAHGQTAAVDVHYGTQVTWDYYQKVHGRSGIRDNGVAHRSRVHFDNDYTNAFWLESCYCAFYGDGKDNLKPLTQIDVVAHEMTHGVTAATANLRYGRESGALNEATSDIMSAAVEFWAGNPSDPGDYLVAEKADVWGDGSPGRYMDKPSKDGYAVDHWYPGVGSLDEHDSSGIGNHWFYLASEGSGRKTVNGVDYDSPTYDGRPVTPVGREAAARIWYRALTVYMNSATDYAGARTATLRAAADLYGLGSGTYLDAAAAWAAVNVGTRIEGVVLTGPGDQSSVLGKPVGLQVRAASTNAGPLVHTAAGLPAGLSIDRSTGLISGTPTAEATNQVTVKVTDAAGAMAETRLTWRVRGFAGVFENTARVPIPDYGAAVHSGLVVSGVPGNAPADLRVGVDIKHPYGGDLTIDLMAPDGTEYPLKPYAGTGDKEPYVPTAYTVNAASEVANGEWRLKVQDLSSDDLGHIDAFRLTF